MAANLLKKGCSRVPSIPKDCTFLTPGDYDNIDNCNGDNWYICVDRPLINCPTCFPAHRHVRSVLDRCWSTVYDTGPADEDEVL